MNKKPTSRIKGSAIALVLFVVIILLIIGAAVLSLGMHSRSMATRAAAEISARCAADAGLVKALFEMNQKLQVKPWDGSNLPSATESLPNCDAFFSYIVTGDATNGYLIESTGMYGSATEKVRCKLVVRSPFETALFGNRQISLKSGTTISAYNMPEGKKLKIGTNSILEGMIIARAGVTIDGDVFVGVGGDPNIVINTKNEAVITGDTYALTEEYSMPQIAVPQYLADLPSMGNILNSTVLTGLAKCDSISLYGGEKLVIDGPVYLYVTGSVTFDNFSELQIVDATTNPDAYLNLYLGGAFMLQNGSLINNNSADPRKLKIYGLNTALMFQFQVDSIFYGAIYAPLANITLQNSVEVFGSIITRQLTQQVAANYHYDGQLLVGSPNDEHVKFVVGQWFED